MPELPEVETTRRGITEQVTDRTISAVRIRESRLRWPIPPALPERARGRVIRSVDRRGKYLLLDLGGDHLLIHLGMSGSLRLCKTRMPPDKHDHFDIELDSGLCLRFQDPRRFGCLLWVPGDPSDHELIRHLGPEPLGDEFTEDWLHGKARGRKMPVKSFIMDSRILVGVGNIYANEALFLAGIHPLRAAGRISRARYAHLTRRIREVLNKAILQGGTTLRDFMGSDGKPGYFSQQLNVYGRGAEPCVNCGSALREIRVSNRSTVYCPHCQR